MYFIKDMRGENSRKHEAALHAHFADYKIAGEWFNAPLGDIIAVARIMIPHTKDYDLC